MGSRREHSAAVGNAKTKPSAGLDAWKALGALASPRDKPQPPASVFQPPCQGVTAALTLPRKCLLPWEDLVSPLSGQMSRLSQPGLKAKKKSLANAGRVGPRLCQA